MKHLKSFNENVEEFCAMYLVNIKDTGCDFFLRKSGRTYTLLIFKDYNRISWDSIKDDFIPFLYILNKEYTINSLPYYGDSSSYRYIDKSPSNRTIRFNNTDNSTSYYYSNIENIIDDRDYPISFTQIQINFKTKH